MKKAWAAEGFLQPVPGARDTRVCVCICARGSARACVCTCTRVYVHARVSAHIPASVCAHMRELCVHVCVRVCAACVHGCAARVCPHARVCEGVREGQGEAACVSACGECLWGCWEKGLALLGPQGVELGGPGYPKTPGHCGAPCSALALPGGCDLVKEPVGSGARLSGSGSQLCR